MWGPASSWTSRKAPARMVSAASRAPLMICHSSGRFLVGEESKSTCSAALRMIACTATAEQANRRVPWTVVRNGWCVDIVVLLRQQHPTITECMCVMGRRMARQSHGAPVLGVLHHTCGEYV